MGWLERLFGCWKCHGSGEIVLRGPRIPADELTAAEYGEYLALGTHFYLAERASCPRCGPR